VDDDAGGLPFVVAVGAYTVAAHGPQRHVQVAAGYMYAVLVAMLFNDNPGFGAAELATSGSRSGGAMLVGWTLQTRWRRTEVLEREPG
jgi:hypothetical protein